MNINDMKLKTSNYVNGLSDNVSNYANNVGTQATNYANDLSNKVGNLSTNQKMGAGALAAGGLTAAGLGIGLGAEHLRLEDLKDNMDGQHTIEFNGNNPLDTKIVYTPKEGVTNEYSIEELKNHTQDNVNHQAMVKASPGIIAGAGAVGAIGARIGSHKPQQR